MNRWVYDIELMGGNFFCVTFINVETKEVKVFTIFDNVNQVNELSEFLDDSKELVGYNNIDYDNPVLQYIVQNKDDYSLLKNAQEFSSDVINLERGGYSQEIKNYKNASVKYKQIDLMKIIEVNGNVPSLKMVGIILHWHKIQDLPFEFDRPVKNWKEANLIISYNLNDVLISEKLYEKIYKDIVLREDLSVMYNLDLMNFSDSRMGDKLFEKFYAEKTGVRDVYKLKDEVVDYEKFYVGECLFPDIKFQSNYMKRILKEISETLVREDNNYAYSKIVTLGGVDYAMGSGGLHSVDTPAKFVSDEKYILRDCDFSSYYPSMMIKNNIYPAHIDPQFIDILKNVTTERIEAKKTDKVKAAGLKVLINAIFGKLKFKGSWFRDATSLMKVTVPGQLYLLMLIERFVLSGIQVISANTDGIVCRISRDKEGIYTKLAEDFSKEIGIGIEFTDYELYFRRDVNNYLSKKHEDVKFKGVYTPYAEIKKGYKYPVVAKAVYEYLINNIPVEDTILTHKDILDFCASQKMSSDFSAQYHHDTGDVEYLQKTNRFFISKAGGKLIKKSKKDGKEIGLYVGKSVRILNDYDEKIPFDTYDIDYDYYLQECHALFDDMILFEEEMKPFEDEDENYSPPQEDKEKSELSYELRSMKGLPEKVVENLVWLNRNFSEGDFLDFLIFGEENQKLSSKFEDLIKIGYFSRYGSGKKLISIFQEFRKGKSKYTNKLSVKSKEKRLIELREIYNLTPEEDFSVMEKIANEINILGKIESKFENLKKRIGFVLELDVKNSPKAKIQSLRTGNVETFKIQKKIFSKNEFCVGQLLNLPNGAIEKKQSVRFAGSDENGKPKYENVEGKYDYWLLGYDVVNTI